MASSPESIVCKDSPPHLGWPSLRGRMATAITMRMYKLIATEATALDARPGELIRRGDAASRQHAEEFAESCLLSLAVWRRFGTVEFAEELGWIERTDYAAMASLVGRAVEAAVLVWRAGRHAVTNGSAMQRCARAEELRAWEFGSCRSVRCGSDGGITGSCMVDRFKSDSVATGDLVTQRATSARLVGEAVVRAAYERLLGAVHHPIWDLWRKRQTVVAAALGNGGLAALRQSLLEVKGYGGTDPDMECAGWELSFDLKTMTPLSDDAGPVDWCGDYVVWLRKHTFERLQPSLAAPTHSRRFSRKSQQRARERISVDCVGFRATS